MTLALETLALTLKKRSPLWKQCISCSKFKTLKMFHKNKIGNKGHYPRCKACRSLVSQKRYWKDPNVSRALGMKRRYGINIAQYEQMVIAQNNKCAICEIHQNDLKKRLSVDHCHLTKMVRGLLCENCNLGLGKFKENKNIIQKSLDYLRSYNG